MARIGSALQGIRDSEKLLQKKKDIYRPTIITIADRNMGVSSPTVDSLYVIFFSLLLLLLLYSILPQRIVGYVGYSITTRLPLVDRFLI